MFVIFPIVFGEGMLYLTEKRYKLNSVTWESIIAFILSPYFYFLGLIVPISLMVFMKVNRVFLWLILAALIIFPVVGNLLYHLNVYCREHKTTVVQLIKDRLAGKKEIPDEEIAKDKDRIELLYQRSEFIQKKLREKT